ncbi:hypothetical protein [Melghirimyces algeriensis]|uniref:Uncharacterized protein n=1 Tax=Melghirimyces algeriensis TaxID=910412 RepID=A0A521CIK4_9BACL|nr:hypothetical protein [Melghirimyces algeriensis]SMO59222.1 hypothetical protein SAMN06264849_1047 [Melghirimyces algeriensis]
MPYSDFIQVKGMKGELLVSQKQHRLGCTLTTQELIFQKPHLSYQIMLSDILGITPVPSTHDVPRIKSLANTEIRPLSVNPFYRITTNQVSIIDRTGSSTRESTCLMVPLSDRFIHFIQLHTDLISLPFT